jgi:hypothetical protein
MSIFANGDALRGARLERTDALLEIADLAAHREIVFEEIANLAHRAGDAHDFGCEADLGFDLAAFEASGDLVEARVRAVDASGEIVEASIGSVSACVRGADLGVDAFEDFDGEVGGFHGELP